MSYCQFVYKCFQLKKLFILAISLILGEVPLVDTQPLFRENKADEDVFPSMTKKEIKNTVKNFESKNGNALKDISVKELVLLFHKEIAQRCDKLDKKLEDHLDWSFKNTEKGYETLNKIQKTNLKAISEHDLALQIIAGNMEKIVSDMPEKGFCSKVTSELELDKDVTLSDKVEMMWNDRRWIKALIGAVIAMGGANIIIQFM